MPVIGVLCALRCFFRFWITDMVSFRLVSVVYSQFAKMRNGRSLCYFDRCNVSHERAPITNHYAGEKYLQQYDFWLLIAIRRNMNVFKCVRFDKVTGVRSRDR